MLSIEDSVGKLLRNCVGGGEGAVTLPCGSPLSWEGLSRRWVALPILPAPLRLMT